MALQELGKATGVSITDDSTDIRGWTALDADGRRIGQVDELIFDPEENLVRFVVVNATGRRVLWPVSRLGFHDRDRAVMLKGLTADGIAAVAPYEGVDAIAPDAVAAIAPDAVAAPHPVDSGVELGEEPRRIQLLEERLLVDKRRVERKRLTINKRQVAEETTQDVPLSEEHFEVTRRLVDRPASGNEAPRVEGDVTIIPVIAERLVVEKRAFVVEEIIVTKRKKTRVEQVRDTLMHEEVDITEQAIRDDDRPTDRT
ncbi:Stress response protein YsnF [compost metagenome]